MHADKATRYARERSTGCKTTDTRQTPGAKNTTNTTSSLETSRCNKHQAHSALSPATSAVSYLLEDGVQHVSDLALVRLDQVGEERVEPLQVPLELRGQAGPDGCR
jgi:hypothetical protein